MPLVCLARATRAAPHTAALAEHYTSLSTVLKLSVQENTVVSVPDPPITTSPDRLSGTPVFAGTRVPVQTLIDYLEAGDSLDEFLADFPSVSREHAVAVLRLAKTALLDKAVIA